MLMLLSVCPLANFIRRRPLTLENDCTQRSAAFLFRMSTRDPQSTKACNRVPPTTTLIVIASATAGSSC